MIDSNPVLAVVIVSYNVEHFLDQALQAVYKAARMPIEVWVVDNCSSDGSCEMVRTKFPQVNLIENRVNVGFAKANNQAIRQSKSEFVLLLNPDTLVEESTFERCLDLMRARTDVGGLGVYMIDGRGQYLPESKRGFPSPWVAFCKTFGLARIFPRSARFNQYHLGHLKREQDHEIEVLSGAFMLMRKAVLDEVGLLDESFFMYGEDIDLSYRIIKGGYKNYYLSKTKIIHFKGESTKKGSLNYVRTFYQAMIIFARKHFRGREASLYIGFIHLAIYFRASLSLVYAWFRRLMAPLLDGVLIYLGLWALMELWARIRFEDPDYFPAAVFYLNFPLYIGLWLFCLYLRGAYDRQANLRHWIEGLIWGSLLVAAVYGFLPLDLRNSRMLVLLGGVWAFGIGLGWRALFQSLGWYHFDLEADRGHHLAIVGRTEEALRVRNLLYEAHIPVNYLGHILLEEGEQHKEALGYWKDLDALVAWYRLEELVFCEGDLSNEAIIGAMARLGSRLRYKMVLAGGGAIIGSDSKDSAGELYALELRFALAQPLQQRHKRLFDVFLALVLFLTLPLHIFYHRKKGRFIKRCWLVFLGRLTWVGYQKDLVLPKSLPRLKPSVLHAGSGLERPLRSPQALERLHLLYAKDWRIGSDWQIFKRGFRDLGN